MQCVACHKEITDSAAPHRKNADEKVTGCVACHLDLWETTKAQNLTKEKARLGVVVANIENYMNSFHARPNKEDPSRVNAACDDCHNTHTFNVPSQGTTRRTEWHLTIPNVCGEKCHADELDEYKSSVHGGKVFGEHNIKAAVCTDCHTTHEIGNTSKVTFKTDITEKCGNCHAENLKSYRSTYHGQVNKLGYGYTAKCYDCHGSHGIRSPKDPQSKVNLKNRLKTCQQCHKGATEGFTTFSPHANTHDFERYPQVWVVTRFMWALLIGVFAFFWVHLLMWWYRESEDGHKRKNHPDMRNK
jgi:RNase P subunit RPR2